MWQLEIKIRLRALLSLILTSMELNHLSFIGDSRVKELVIARQIFVLMAKRNSFSSNPDTLACIINRDRSSVYACEKTALNREQFDDEFKNHLNAIINKGGNDMLNITKQITDVHYNVKRMSLMVEFADGSKYGEIGEIAKATFARMSEKDFDINKEVKCNKENQR